MIEDDLKFMKEALELAKKGRHSVSPNPAVGCIIVKNGTVIATGYHEKAGDAHAEVVALREAGSAASGADVYVTLEPCNHDGRTGPCSAALIAAGVKRVVCALLDPNPAVKGGGCVSLREKGIRVDVGLCEDRARRINEGFFCRVLKGRPRIRVKVAMSLDANSAMKSGESKWITGVEARQDVQRLRAESCAILTGVGTVISDDPSLNVRCGAYSMLGRQPRRIILDTFLRTPPAAKMLDMQGETIVFTASEDGLLRNNIRNRGAMVEVMDRKKGVVDFEKVICRLADLDTNDLLIEAGSMVTRNVLQSGLWDQLVVYVAPKIIGRQGLGALGISSPELLGEVLQLSLEDHALLGNDLRLTFRNLSARGK